MSIGKHNQLTVDSIWTDQIWVAQPKQGYRFGIDSVLLAQFVSAVERTNGIEALEIGAGSGVVSILCAHFNRTIHITAVEFQPELAELCRRNVQQNDGTAIEVLEADARSMAQQIGSQTFDLIFSNPPYRKLGDGRLNPNKQKAIARHELSLTLGDLFSIVCERLKTKGEFCIILPEFRYDDVEVLRQKHTLSWSRLQWVKSFRNQPPVFFLASFTRELSDLKQPETLVIYESVGVYTREAERLLRADSI